MKKLDRIIKQGTPEFDEAKLDEGIAVEVILRWHRTEGDIQETIFKAISNKDFKNAKKMQAINDVLIDLFK